MTTEQITNCPACLTPLSNPTPAPTMGEDYRVSCNNCGHHTFSWRAFTQLRGQNLTPLDRTTIAHMLTRCSPDEVVGAEHLYQLAKSGKLPTPLEQIDNVVLYLAGRHRPTHPEAESAYFLRAHIGVETAEEARWALLAAMQSGLVSGRDTLDPNIRAEKWSLSAAALTAAGWRRHQEMQRGGIGLKRAFMAMRFSDEMKLMVDTHFKPAVAETDFVLETTLDQAQAGNIIARMKVEIHTCRFVICDLSDANNGAYWEAGFAEGLGKPVIYTCKGEVMDTPLHPCRPHFDKAQDQIVKWDPANMAEAMAQLKQVIRATLPAEAKMRDG